MEAVHEEEGRSGEGRGKSQQEQAGDGESDEQRRRGRQGQDALVQHERRHLDHMHVRFFNREAQEHGRLAYPLLVEAGLLPGPMVKHRAANGETLSHLARRYGTSAAIIRSANGIHGSSLRAGRVYSIPVRKIPTPGEPVVVPPRRLPPGPPPAPEAATASAFPSR